jgi:hypothetical protein
MKLPLQITFRNMKSSALLEEWVRAEAAKLETLQNHIMACRVAIEVPHRHHKNGKPLHVRIDLTLPGREIVIRRDPVSRRGPRMIVEGDALIRLHPMLPHHDLHLAIHDAFKIATRRLHNFARYRRVNVKAQRKSPAMASAVHPVQEYGFLEEKGGRIQLSQISQAELSR